MEPINPVNEVKSQIIAIATHEVMSVWWSRTLIGVLLVVALTWPLGVLSMLGWTVAYSLFMFFFITAKVMKKADQIFAAAETSIVQLLKCDITARSPEIVGRLGDVVAHEWIDAQSGDEAPRRFVFHDFGEPGNDMPENQLWLFVDGVTYVPQPAREEPAPLPVVE